MSSDDASDRSCLELQLSELDLLLAMFPADHELVLEDDDLVRRLRLWTEKRPDEDERPPEGDVAFRLTVAVSSSDEEAEQTGAPVTANFVLSRGYPLVMGLDVYLRSDAFDRASQHAANDALAAHLESVCPVGDLQAGEAVNWIQERAAQYFQARQTADADSVEQEASCDITYTRMWIYSHHLYSKTKRRDLLSLASRLDLTGFSLVGKPCAICLEGAAADCDAAWAAVRTWTWQRITLRRREDGCERRSFARFQELVFDGMAEFKGFLEGAGQGDVFAEMFGIGE